MISPRHSRSPEQRPRYPGSSRYSEGWQVGSDSRSSSSVKTTSPRSSTSAASKPSLAQAITDEFLVCKICLEGYKSPKCLECLHTFCEQCIESHVSSESSYKKYSDYREFTCPLCRKRTQMPIGGVKKLPDNFLVSNLSEMVGRQRPSKFPLCDFCKLVDNKLREAHAKCLDCCKMLCPSCVSEHQEINVTSSHSIFDVDIEKDIGCKEHPDETVRYFCVPCETCVCVVCTFKEHRQHKVTQFSEAVTSYRDVMKSLVSQCKSKIEKLDAHVTSLNKCEGIIVEVRERIQKTAGVFVEEVRERERVLLDELDTVYGTDCIESIERKADLSNQVESLRSTCKLAETILHGKDIELLLLRKDVQDKLQLLNRVEAKTLPITVNKVVEFISGAVDFGHLHDHDRPLLTTMSVRKALEQSRDPAAGKLQPSSASFSASGSDDCRIKVSVRKKTRKKRRGQESLSSDSDDSDEDEDDDDDDEDNDDDDSSSDDSDDSSEKKKKKKKKGVVKMVDRCTMTDVVVLMDRGVNTKARSLRTGAHTPQQP